jgi:hypothetical protein
MHQTIKTTSKSTNSHSIDILKEDQGLIFDKSFDFFLSQNSPDTEKFSTVAFVTNLSKNTQPITITAEISACPIKPLKKMASLERKIRQLFFTNNVL